MPMKSLTRVYCHYEQWEEYRWGMWRILSGTDRESLEPDVITVLCDINKFRSSLHSALMRWPVSCAVNMTNRSSNRAAWLWHAGACIVTSAPEDVTRSVWMKITQEQREEADRVAWEVVHEWEHEYIMDGGRKYADANLHLPEAGMSSTDQATDEVLQEA